MVCGSTEILEDLEGTGSSVLDHRDGKRREGAQVRMHVEKLNVTANINFNLCNFEEESVKQT